MRPENILIVDDNQLLRTVLTRSLMKEYQNVVAVGTGEEAIKQIADNFYHIVILDKQLPDIDGLDILGYSKMKSPQSRVMMITSHTEQDVREEALRRGAFEFLEKPFDFDRLRRALRELRVCKQVPAIIGESHKGMTHNLSNSGMLINTNAVFQCGATVDVLLHVSDGREIPLKGTVVRTDDLSFQSSSGDCMKYALGMRLIDPPDDYHSYVESLIS